MSVDGFTAAQERLLDRFQVPAESRFVDVPSLDCRAHVLVTGEGPPVVMVIGGGAPAAMWAPLMPELSGFTLYAVDRPGFGLTDPVRCTPDNLRSNAVTFLEGVLDGLELDNPVFVANSMGALWTSWLALDRPERVAAMVQIGCTALILDTFAPLPMRLLAVPPIGRLMMKMQSPSPKQVDQVLGMMNESADDLPELRDLMLACERLPSYGPAWLELLDAVGGLRGPRPGMSLDRDQLARIVQPTQFIWGEDDPFGSPEAGRRASEIIPNSELHVIAGGHTPWLTQAERIGRLAVPFIREHSDAVAESRVA